LISYPNVPHPHPNTTAGFLSDYHGFKPNEDLITPLAAAHAKGVDVEYAAGCGLNGTLAQNATAIADAVGKVAEADIAVLFLGLCGNNRKGPGGTVL
jgi:hypothetical protein